MTGKVTHQTETPQADLVLMSAVKAEAVSWLWPLRLPLGKLVVIDGDPGTNKTTATLDIAARLSRGDPMPDGTRSDVGPVGAVFLNAEDGPADTLRPRLEAAGANLDRICLLEGVKTSNGLRLPTVHDDGPILEAIIAANAQLVVIDPLMAYLGADVNSHRDQDIRGALAPLARLAERCGVCVTVVRHLNKGSQSSNPLYRGGGSIGIIGAARVGMVVAADPDDEDRRILAINKCNLAAKAPSLAFRPQTDIRGRLVIHWEGEDSRSAKQLLAEPENDEERSALDEASEVVRDILEPGRVEARDVFRATRRAGISDRTVKRAKARLGIRSEKERGTADGKWYWVLPSTNGAGPLGPLGPLPSDPAEQGDPSKSAKSAKSAKCSECGRELLSAVPSGLCGSCERGADR